MPKNPGQLLVGLRIAVGVGALFSPRLAGRLFGLDVDANPQAAYLARLFGVRDIVLGIGTMRTTGPSRRMWWQLGVATDATDVVSAKLGGKDGSLPTSTVVLAGGTAAIATALGVAAMASDA